MTWESSFTSEPSLSGVSWNVLESINPPFSRDMAWSRKSLRAERPAYNTLTWNIIISSLTWTSQSSRDNLLEHSFLTLNIRASGISVPLTRSVPLKMFFIICHIRIQRGHSRTIFTGTFSSIFTSETILELFTSPCFPSKCSKLPSVLCSFQTLLHMPSSSFLVWNIFAFFSIGKPSDSNLLEHSCWHDHPL